MAKKIPSSYLNSIYSYKAEEEGKDFYKCLMIYHNSPLTGRLQSSMQILQSRNARSDLPMSNAARKQLGIQPEVVRNSDKHMMFPDLASKLWYLAVIKSLCPETRC